MDPSIKTIQSLLDPLHHGVRRAVVTDDGLVQDKTHHPDLTEIQVLSNICHVVFHTEPRDAQTLLHRAFIEDIQTAWDALADDIRLGIVEYTGFESYIQHVYPCIRNAYTFEKVYVAASLLAAYHEATDIPMNGKIQFQECVSAVRKYTTHPKYQDLVAAFQKLVRSIMFPVRDIGDILTTNPESCDLCIYHPHIDQVCISHPEVVQILSDAAMALAPPKRQPYMVMLALFSRHGSRITHPVGLDTLVALRHHTFHLNLAAASAVLAQPQTDSTVASLCALIETLCTVIQKTCHIDMV